MPGALAFLAVHLVLGTPVVGNPDLVALAGASPRPLVCRAEAGASSRSLWSRARGAATRRYCAELARGYALLGGRPTAALEAAEAAEAAWPGQAPPLVLAARALLAGGHPELAAERFERALLLDPRALQAPEALHERGVAALLTGEFGAARAAYRQLIPRVGLLAEPGRRVQALTEAAAVVMGEGVSALDEAASYLGEARRRASATGQRPLVLGMLALTLSRQGRQEPARGVLAEADGALLDDADTAGSEAVARAVGGVTLPPGERQAVAAMLAEGVAREEAADAWRAYLESMGADGIWSAHARQRLDGLVGGLP